MDLSARFSEETNSDFPAILLQSDSARSNFAAAKIPKVQEACLKPQVTERSALPLDLHHAPPCALHLGELPHLRAPEVWPLRVWRCARRQIVRGGEISLS